jgi:uncharacterized membrane protein YdjX (TVP38/TMEM64 family)
VRGATALHAMGMNKSSRRDTAILVAAALLLGAVSFALWHLLKRHGIDLAALDEAAVERFVRAWGAWSALASVALMVLHSFVPLPAEIIPIANGMLFGPLIGIALTWAGAMLGAALSFALARWLGRGFVRLVLSEARFQRLAHIVPRPGTLLYVRLVPLISFNLVNYAAGLMDVPWWTFLWTTALGILPLTVAMVLLGAAMLRAPLWLSAAIAAALLLLWLAVARRRGWTKTAGPDGQAGRRTDSRANR